MTQRPKPLSLRKPVENIPEEPPVSGENIVVEEATAEETPVEEAIVEKPKVKVAMEKETPVYQAQHQNPIPNSLEQHNPPRRNVPRFSVRKP